MYHEVAECLPINMLRRGARLAALALVLACVLLSAPPINAQVNVVTYHNDSARTGANLNETILTPDNVTPATFGKLFTQPVDGDIYAQPLYLSNVEIPGVGTRNVVFVVTEHDSVYAFDADSNDGPSGGLLWHVSFIDPDNGVTSVPSAFVPGLGYGDIQCCCPDLIPEVGITGTPVIDPAKGILYVISKTKQVRGPDKDKHYVQTLHALDVKTGAELAQFVIGDTIWITGGMYIFDDFGPTVIGSPQAADYSVADGLIHFNALTHNVRSGLVLANGVIYAAWGGHCDRRPYHGWIMGFDAATLQLTFWFNTTPGSPESSFSSWGGGIWMGGAAPAVDDRGNLYCSTGNGGVDEDPDNNDYGEAVIRLSTADLSLADFFIPYNQRTLDVRDLDLGSGGVMLLPDQKTGRPHLLIIAGKEGVYLIDRDRMGGYRGCGPTCDDVVQTLPPGTIGQVRGAPALYQNLIYYAGAGDPLKAFGLSGGRLSTTPLSQSSARFGFFGATPSVSAHGDEGGIVWVIKYQGPPSNAVLYAFDAVDLSRQLYFSSGPDEILGGTRFSVPTIANGKVYVGTGRSCRPPACVEDTFDGLVVFGLLNPSDGAQR